MKTILSAAIGATLWLLATETGAQAKAAERKVEFAIEQQRLADALNEWAKQSGLQLMSPSSEMMNNTVAPSVKGVYTAQAALDELLKGMALTYEWVNERAVAILEKSPVVPAALRLTPEEREHSRTTPYQSGAMWNVVRLAANDETPREQRDLSRQSADRDGDHAEEVEEIVVTGTHIRGIDALTAPIMIYDRAFIERSGYTSTAQLVRSLPQNFSGGGLGATEDGHVGPGALAQTNVSNSTGLNLRGLGNTSTLVLVNGHRVAPSAYGATIDVSLIPLAAVERVEVLMDGSSAIYGSDAVAGVVNFILRRDYEGAETRGSVGAVTEGSTSETILSQILGASWASGGIVASGHYRNRDALPSSDRAFAKGAPQPTDLLPKSQQYSLVLNAHQGFGERINAFVDASHTYQEDRLRYATADNAQMTDSTTYHPTVNAGLGYRLSDTWRLELSGLYSSERTDLTEWDSLPPPGYRNGDPLLRNDFDLSSVDLKADGELWSIAGGRVRAAIGGSHRSEEFSSLIPYLSEDRRFSRDVDAAFAEVHVPIIGKENVHRFARTLSFSAAVRHDDYSDFGDTTNPRLGVLWSPTDDLTIRASYSESFRAPNASEQVNANNVGVIILNFPFASPSGTDVPVFMVVGSDRILMPEQSRNHSIGFDYEPSALPGLKLSASYYNIDFSNRIVTPPFDTAALLRPEVYGSLVTSLAGDSEAQAFLDDQLARGAVFFDLLGTGATDVRYIFSRQQQNAAEVTQSGFDLSAAYSWITGLGAFDARTTVSVIHEIQTAFAPGSTATDLVDTYNNPLRARARADFAWTRGSWSANAAINYSGEYVDTSVVPRADISAWTTMDLNLRLTPGARFGGLSFALSALNVFDKDPPSVGGLGLTGIRYDTANAAPLGRFVVLEVKKTW